MNEISNDAPEFGQSSLFCDLKKKITAFMRTNKNINNEKEILNAKKILEEFDLELEHILDKDPNKSEYIDEIMAEKKKIIEFRHNLEVKSMNVTPGNLSPIKIGSNNFNFGNPVIEESKSEGMEGSDQFFSDIKNLSHHDLDIKNNHAFDTKDPNFNLNQNIPLAKNAISFENKIVKEISFQTIFTKPTSSQLLLQSQDRNSYINKGSSSLRNSKAENKDLSSSKNELNYKSSPFELAPHDNTYEQNNLEKIAMRDEEISKLRTIIAQKDILIEEIQSQYSDSNSLIMNLNREIEELKIHNDMKEQIIQKLRINKLNSLNENEGLDRDSKNYNSSKMAKTLPSSDFKRKKIFEPSKELSFSSIRSKLKDLDNFDSRAQEEFEKVLDRKGKNRKLDLNEINNQSIDSFGFNSILLQSEEQSQAIYENYIPTNENDDSKINDLIYPYPGIKDYYMKKSFKVVKGNELIYDAKLDQLFKDFDSITIKNIKKACLVNKSIIFSNRFLQIGIINNTFQNKENYDSLIAQVNLFYGNQFDCEIKNLKRVNGNYSDAIINHLESTEFHNILPKHQVKENLEIKIKGIKSHFIFSEINYRFNLFSFRINNIKHTLLFVIPIPVIRFLEFTECNIIVFKSQFKDKENTILKSQLFKLGHKGKPWEWVKKLFPNIIMLNSSSEEGFIMGHRVMKFGLISTIFENERIGIRFNIQPDNCGIIQISFQKKNTEICQEILNFFVFVLKASSY